mmetsp:Transcript_54947/g.176206  ORF Transcript_54947/g.176206 Transcript_54947/m.176206 type:complete len:247 (-) Transcript_54947:544-1284(-)
MVSHDGLGSTASCAPGDTGAAKEPVARGAAIFKHMLTPLEQQAIRDVAGNDMCFDCGAERPEWASVSFGITICFACAGRHRGYGVHISFVRSLELDAWSQAEVRSMMLGGNTALRECLGPAVEGACRADLYQAPAAALYRQRLRALREGREPPKELEAEAPAARQEAVRPAAEAAPRWATERSCMLCGRGFTVLVRRHHCRRCGRSVCGDCGPRANTRPIPEWQMAAPVRHCRDCFRSPALEWRGD